MIETTLSSRHRIRNSSHGGLRPSTLPLGHGGSHNTDFHTWMGKKHFLFLSNRRDREPGTIHLSPSKRGYLICKSYTAMFAKRYKLLTFQVSSYCLLALQSSIVMPYIIR